MKKVACFDDLKFEAHVYEIQEGSSSPKPKIVIRAKLMDDLMDLREDKAFVKALEINLSNALKLSANMTLADLIGKGIFMPLEIEFADVWENNLKTLSIVPHF